MTTSSDFLTELSSRSLLHQASHEEALRAHLASGVRRAYVGFDPTADSLTIGNFIPIKLLMHWQRAGHQPVVVMGGGTGLIGDPSGKSAERQLLTRDAVEHNVERQRLIFERLLDFSGPTAALLHNNLDWLGQLSFIEALRDVGKHFSVNAMMQRDSVRERLHHREQGISYTEFSYMLLQSYDYLHLRRSHGVTVQMGGSDQWGNIVSGCDLVRRVLPDGQNQSFAVTAPLVTRSDGGKFGKSESGAIWLSPERTSPYAFYQFWLNTDDGDLLRYLRFFTFFSVEEIAELQAAHEKDPGARSAHRALARHMTELLHGPSERAQAEAAAQALFSGDVRELSEQTLREVFAAVPTSSHDKNQLSVEGLSLVEILAQTTLCKSKREAREFLQSGSVSVSGRKVGADDKLLLSDLLHGRLVAIRRGKKSWHLLRFE
ncbi:MAG: tyrosine--tRNA ligase [Deltaproteobacteria bacterium]|nr:tyrosine--tRNA ligase [Deltaproteobacteria bacterium]